jgi:hypothetical protein
MCSWNRFTPWSAVAVFAVAVFAVATSAAGQSALMVHDADLAVPFGSAKGLVAFAGDQIMFVSPDNRDASLLIVRGDIRTASRSGDVVTVTTRRAIGDGAGSRDTFRFRLSGAEDLMAWYEKGAAGPASAAAAPASAGPSDVLSTYQVKHDHRIGSCQGRLILMSDRVGFESIDDINDSRQWMLADLKEVKQDGIYKLQVEPFFGDTFNFELAGKGMDSGEYRRLVDRIAKARSAR